MSQYELDLDASTDTGTTLETALESFQGAILTGNSGSSAPSYKEAGTIWIDTTATTWDLKIYSGSAWVTFGYVNTTTGVFSPVPLGQVGTKEVDETDIADGKRLAYDSGSGKVVYVSPT